MLTGCDAPLAGASASTRSAGFDMGMPELDMYSKAVVVVVVVVLLEQDFFLRGNLTCSQ